MLIVQASLLASYRLLGAHYKTTTASVLAIYVRILNACTLRLIFLIQWASDDSQEDPKVQRPTLTEMCEAGAAPCSLPVCIISVKIDR